MDTALTPSVSIAIPAHNEQATIKELLSQLIQQNAIGFELKEIIVLSDISTDDTVARAKSVDDARIKIIETPERMGQNRCQNTLFRMAEGDIVVFMEANMIPHSPLYIRELIAPILKDEVSCTYGATEPWLSSHGLASLFYFIESAKVLAFRSHRRGKNVLTCRSGKAVRKSRAANLNWPPDVAEDAYFYLFSRYTLRSVQYVRQAVLYYHVPNSLADYFMESMKFATSKRILKRYFPKRLINKEYSLSGSINLRFVSTLMRRPHVCSFYLFLLCASRFVSLFIVTHTPTYKVAHSTKIHYGGV